MIDMSKNNKKVQSRARRRALSVLARMRNRGESLSQAARFEHTTPRTVRKLLGKQLKRRSSGRYSATRSDTLRRDIYVLSSDGYVPVAVRSWKQTQLASEHLIAVGHFVGITPSRLAGDPQLLKPFVGKRVGGVELLTDPVRLHELAHAGLIKLDSFYREHGGGRQEKQA
jgi:hypothetical protein